jgi:hypothetical protein
MLAAPAKISPNFSSCWLHRQKYRRIFRHADCIGENIAVFFVMLAASAKIQPILHTRWNTENSQPHFCLIRRFNRKCSNIFAYAARIDENVATFLLMLPASMKM